MIRFGELLLNKGRWRGQQIIRSDYVRACGRLSNYNPHTPLQPPVNGDGHVQGVPHDAFWETGLGGHCLYVVPSLEIVIWKLGGRDEQYSAANTGIEDAREYDGSREGWKSGITEGRAAIRVLQTVAAACA
jgi:CubicO group peptidase (beta-lactamase class C family)